MRNIKIILIVSLIISFFSCDKEVFEKPKNLIKEKQMIELLIDIHLAESTFQQMRHDTVFKKFSSADFYYSVLEKHHVTDSVFEKSLVYYASYPKKFEDMYREIMNRLSQMEKQYSGRRDELEFGEEE